MEKYTSLVGKKWGEIASTDREALTKIMQPVDVTGEHGSRPISGKVTIDFLGTPLSIFGHVEQTEEEEVITIDQDAVIYSSELD